MRPLVCCLALAATAAPAAETVDEVLVTARRVAEEVRTLPLAIDVVQGDELGSGSVDGMQALSLSVPGLSFESFWGGSGATPVLRAQAQPSAAGDNVGVFVDDLYQAGRSSMDIDPLDVERIEVLRGPQNAQFGRSTFAGAIRYLTRRPAADASQWLEVDAGSDGLFGVQGMLTGPMGSSGWLGRIAYGHRQADGTVDVQGARDAGGMRSDSIAVGLDLDADENTEREAMFTVRLGDASFGHPYNSTVTAASYDCGAANASSGIWSYYCGELPVASQISLTPDLPDSRSRYGQFAAQLTFSIGNLKLRSLTGFYLSSSNAVRDFDGTNQGFLSGVCRTNVTCGTQGPAIPVDRFVAPNVVSRPAQDVEEFSQEFRLEGGNPDFQWMLGISGWKTRVEDRASFGADRGDLLPDERLTSLLVSNPARVGPVSQLNSALVTDSREQQLLQSEVFTYLSGISAFGMIDWAWSANSRLHVELRGGQEHQRRDSLVANYRPDGSADLPAIDFGTLTPRVSIDYEVGSRWYGYVSLARGARSGGINPNPDIAAAEQEYAPEYNWTTELALRFRNEGVLQAAEATLYYIDWNNTQILGLSTTPGVNSLVISNTAGLTTLGIEARADLRLAEWLRASLSWSGARPQFRAGSDDAGSRAFCGLTMQPPTSDFCEYGPPRTANGSSIALVPYLDGDSIGHSARSGGTLEVDVVPSSQWAGWRPAAQVQLAYKGDSFDRPINGAWYGERTLLGLQLSAQRGPLRLVAWATNLTNERYLRAAASRGGVFYPSMPRPMDLLLGEGRRIGLSASLAF